MDSSTTPTVKPKLSFWQIWNMSFGFLGIQFGFALQNANTSRIFQTLGAEPESLALFWLAAPVTGLLVQPIIGFYSDRTWHPKWGRRRPYFAIGAILASVALCAMPNSASLWMAVVASEIGGRFDFLPFQVVDRSTQSVAHRHQRLGHHLLGRGPAS